MVAGGTAMMPALFMRISRRETVANILFAACLTDANEARSISIAVNFAPGTNAVMEVIAASAFCSLREPIRMCDGLCLASWSAASFPRPVFPL